MDAPRDRPLADRLRALLVEDDENDAAMVVRAFSRAGYDVDWIRVDTAGAFTNALKERSWDVVVSDFSMPAFDAMAALAIVKDTGLDLPFIVVSGTIDEETAVVALKAGASDFVLKGNLARLAPAVARELREAESRRERRIAAAALRETELRFRRIVETAREGIWTFDAAGLTTYMNRRMALMLGTTPEAAIGTTMASFLDEDARAAAERALEGEPGASLDQQDWKFRRADGSVFWASLSTSPIVEPAGEQAGLLVMVTDVTEQRKLQAHLMMSDRMVSVGTLAAGIAHEINNPLACVIANLDLALSAVRDLRGGDLDLARVEELYEELADAHEASRRVQRIVADLKVFSRAEDDERGPVDVERVVDSSVRMAWNEIRHRAKLVKAFAGVPPVEASESRLGQVFLNLIVNAAQAIPEARAGTNEIRITTGLEPDGRVFVEVRDTGTGISPEVMKRLFTPFFTTKPVGFGTGLGLSICHRIVSSLGGDITVDSRVGVGTAFRVRLPALGSGAERLAVKASTAPTSASRRGAVLVVDDERTIGTTIRRILSAEHDVAVAGSVAEAIERVRSGARFDVILCDVMMPHLGGIDLHAELSRFAPEAASRIVFMTGGAFTPQARAFLDGVENPQIEKPFDPRVLRAIVNERIR